MQKKKRSHKAAMYEQANGDPQCFGTNSVISERCGTEHDEDGFPQVILPMPPMLYEDISHTDDQHQNAMEIESHHHLVQQEATTNWLVPPHGHDQEANHVNNILNLLNLPRCSSPLLNTSNYQSTLGFLGVDLQTALDHQVLPTSAAASSYDPPLTTACDPQMFHFNLPPQQPPHLFCDLVFQSPLGNCGGSVLQLAGNVSPLFGDSRVGTDDGGEISQGAHRDSEVLEFSKDPLEAFVATGVKEPRGPKNFVSERQRRITMKDKYKHLRSLVPNPSKVTIE